MKNYEQLKQIIQEANPEIMELKFGCEVEIIDQRYRQEKLVDEFTILGETNEVNLFLALHKHGTTSVNWKDIERFCKILGRHIRLADCILAADKIYKKHDGIFRQETINHRVEIMERWDLLEDLDNQSDETKEFLRKLLKVKR